MGFVDKLGLGFDKIDVKCKFCGLVCEEMISQKDWEISLINRRTEKMNFRRK